MSEEEKILGVIPVFRRIDAVYVTSEEVIREPVIGLVITDYGKRKRDGERSFFGDPLVIIRDGTIERADDCFNYVGIETDGEKKDWSDEIEIERKREEALNKGEEDE